MTMPTIDERTQGWACLFGGFLTLIGQIWFFCWAASRFPEQGWQQHPLFFSALVVGVGCLITMGIGAAKISVTHEMAAERRRRDDYADRR